MTMIKKNDLAQIGYGFVSPSFLSEYENEYSIRFSQQQNDSIYRLLKASERAILLANNNYSSN